MTTDPMDGQPPYDSPPPMADDGPQYGVPYQQQGYQQPGDQQQGYQQGYGPQGYGPTAYYYPPSRPTNVLAILSLVFSLVFAPAGLILGLIARKQLEETGEEGRGLALAGTIIGAVITGFWVLYAAIWVVLVIVFSANA